jgi:xanthosine utilization system XapX-like protein
MVIRDWDSYFVIVGSSAGALTGLQFVVLTLIADSPAAGRNPESLAAFGSPNVVHFCAALLVSAIFSVPWHSLGPPAVAMLITGVLGVIYSLVVMRRARRQVGYQPVLEDWIWHGMLPTLGYAALLLAGLALRHDTDDAMLGIGAASLLLVFIGIHNAWDTVTYVMTVVRAPRAGQAAGTGSPPDMSSGPPTAPPPGSAPPPAAR